MKIPRKSIAGPWALILAILGHLAGCGFVKGEYIPYGEDTEEAPSDPACAVGLVGFQDHLKGPVDATCSGSSCHAGIQKLVLTSGEDEPNRSVLLGFTGTSAQTLTDLIHSASNHPGGDMTTVLPAANITAWLAEEANCP